jgi:L-threonylcarbamoyladenylate synthase
MVHSIARILAIVRLRVNAKLHRFLKRGGIIAYATESCFGLGCDPNHPQALKKLIKLKQRDASKGMIVIGAHLKQLLPLCNNLNPTHIAKLKATWPAPHTFIVKASDQCEYSLTGGKDTIALRVPAHAGARDLCQLAGMAIVSTSANLSGQKSIKTYLAAYRKFAGRVWVMPGKIGHYKKPSTIQDLQTGKILRK